MAARCDLSDGESTHECIPDLDIANSTCETEAELESLTKEIEDEFFKLIDESKVDTHTFTPISIEECGKIIEDEKVILTTIYETVKYPSEDDRIFEIGICFGHSKIKKEDEISITFQLPPDYPNSIPIFQVNDSESHILSFSETDQLYDELLQSAFDQRGSPMLYNLIQQVHDSCEQTILYKKEKFLDHSLHKQVGREYKTITTPTADHSTTKHIDNISELNTQPDYPTVHPSSFISLRDIIDNCKSAGYLINGVENVLRPALANRFIATQNKINLMQKKYKTTKNFSCKPEIVYHGTAETNLPSIVSKGLLIPGTENVRVMHGSAYGVGIYVGTSPAVSMGYTSSSKLLVCALITGLKVPMQNSNVANFRVIDLNNFYVVKNPSQLLPCWVISLSPADNQQGTDLGLLSASTKSATKSEETSNEERQELLEARMRKFLPFGFGPGDRTVILDAGDWDDDDDAILEGRNVDDDIIIDYGIVQEEKSELQHFRFMHELDLETAESKNF